jgi:hypothetical protein
MPNGAVEALDIGILLWLAGLDMAQGVLSTSGATMRRPLSAA